LLLQEEVLKQVQETGLFKHVAAFLSSANSCCRNLLPLSHQDDFPDIAARVCCLGAEILAGRSGKYCCQETCIKCLKANGDKHVTVVSGTVVNGKREHGVDVLVPSSRTKLGCCCSASSNYSGIHPASNDVLTALLLALPPETWSGIKNEKLLQEISILVLTENLPTLLQEEVIKSLASVVMVWHFYVEFVVVQTSKCYSCLLHLGADLDFLPYTSQEIMHEINT
jgi:glutathione gamma-glutamylcysteinyltransferase